MESGNGNGSSINLRPNPSTNSSESEPFISEKKPEISQDPNHIHFIPNATTTNTTATPHSEESSTFLPTNDQTNSSMMEKSDESLINTHLEANHANPFGDFHPSYPNNSETSSLSSSTSQNPFLLLGDDTTTNITHVNTTQSENLHDQVPLEPSLHQPSTNDSSLGNLFQVPTTSTSNDSQKIVEHHDHDTLMEPDHWSFPSHEATTLHGETHASSSSQLLDPLFTLESTQSQQLENATDKNHEASETSTQQHMHDSLNASSNTMEDTNIHPKSHTASETSTQQHMHDSLNASSNTMEDTNIHLKSHTASETSTQQHMHESLNVSSNTKEDTNVHPKSQKDIMLASESSDDDIPISSMPKHEQQSSDVVVVPKIIQNPPIQIMERQEDPAATSSSSNRIPLHVFARNKSNNQWSTASNESLFSIQMGNMSFSNDMALLSKSGDLDNPIDHNHTKNMSGGFQTNHHPILPQPQGNKFNGISRNYGEQDGGSRATEEKAAETMRQVIMESSVAQESKKSKGDSTSANAAARSNKLLYNSNNDHSHHSNGSTRSYAFKVLPDGDKTISSKRGKDTRKQVKQSGQHNVKGTSAAPQNPKSTPNASHNKWKSCFTCCH